MILFLKNKLMFLISLFIFPVLVNANIIHQVKKGDTLFSIAKIYNVCLEDLKTLNNIGDDYKILEGQNLIIPEKENKVSELPSGNLVAILKKGAIIYSNPYLGTIKGQAMEGVQLDVTGKEGEFLKLSILNGEIVYVKESDAEIFQSSKTPSFSNRIEILKTAYSFIGTPYRSGGTNEQGFDCSGFVYHVFLLNGLSLPRSSREQFKMGIPINTKDLLGGDLVFFASTPNSPSHVGIYWGGNFFIHSSSNYGVIFTSLEKSYYKLRFIGARRI